MLWFYANPIHLSFFSIASIHSTCHSIFQFQMSRCAPLRVLEYGRAQSAGSARRQLGQTSNKCQHLLPRYRRCFLHPDSLPMPST
uniref:Uncharacterized protein n=1 Tax=Arundo donax TaxID=35708 RepID=A0A0A9CZJ9_ARUDO